MRPNGLPVAVFLAAAWVFSGPVGAGADQPSAFGPAASQGELTGDEREFADAYRVFLDEARTPLLAGAFLDRTASAFRILDASAPPARLSPGDRVRFSNRGRTQLLAVVGRRPISDGFRLVGAHIDTPAFRVTPAPLAEHRDGAVLRVSEYGGMKPYQWRGTPLRLVGEVRARGGRSVAVDLGASPGPAFTFAASRGEEDPLAVLVSSVPAFDADGEAGDPRLTFLRYLRRRYGLAEADLDAAELYFVPTWRARDVGVDRALIGGHGHDDRACSYAALRALTDMSEVPERTAFVLLTDREEIGSAGTVGAASGFLARAVEAVARATGSPETDFDLGEAFARSQVLSSDTPPGVDPLFPEVHEPTNGAFLGRGPALVKYTGDGGKMHGSDASPEIIAWLRRVWGAAGIPVQTSEIGRVDEGGGGTIAMFLARHGPEVVDFGVPVVSMHSPFELLHKRDLYLAYRADQAFFGAREAAPEAAP